MRDAAARHAALLQGRDRQTLLLDDMLRDLCRQVGQLSPRISVVCTASEGLDLDAERAIPLGLIVSELLTNAVRHAYPEGMPGEVDVRATAADGSIRVAVADGGVGAVADAPPGRSLGASIVQALARQIGATVEVAAVAGQGTTVTLLLPRRIG